MQVFSSLSSMFFYTILHFSLVYLNYESWLLIHFFGSTHVVGVFLLQCWQIFARGFELRDFFIIYVGTLTLKKFRKRLDIWSFCFNLKDRVYFPMTFS